MVQLQNDRPVYGLMASVWACMDHAACRLHLVDAFPNVSKNSLQPQSQKSNFSHMHVYRILPRSTVLEDCFMLAPPAPPAPVASSNPPSPFGPAIALQL